MPSAFFPEEHSKASWPCRPSFFSSLSPVALGHWSVCRLRISLSTLLLGLRFGKFLKCPWVLRRQAWIPGSLLPRACQVKVEAEGRSELWWPVLSWGQWTPLLWRGMEILCVEPGETRQGQSSQSRCLFNLFAFSFSFNCFLGVSNS